LCLGGQIRRPSRAPEAATGGLGGGEAPQLPAEVLGAPAAPNATNLKRDQFKISPLYTYMYVYMPGLACTYFFTFFGRIPKYGFGHEIDRRKMLRTQKHRQIRRLGDPNSMDNVPDQDSAKIFEKPFKLYFAYPSRPGYRCIYIYIYVHICPLPPEVPL